MKNLWWLSIFLLTLSPLAVAYKDRYNISENCPDLKQGATWRDYVSGISHAKPSIGVNVYGVEFRYARAVPDAEIGLVKIEYCYQGYYRDKRKRRGLEAGFMSHGNKSKAVRIGLPGNPLDYEINIAGTLFTYTDEGFVYDRRGRKVAILVCYISDECGRF